MEAGDPRTKWEDWVPTSSVSQQERVGGRGDSTDIVSLLIKITVVVAHSHSSVSALNLNSLFPSFLPVVFGIRASAFEFQGAQFRP